MRSSVDGPASLKTVKSTRRLLMSPLILNASMMRQNRLNPRESSWNMMKSLQVNQNRTYCYSPRTLRVSLLRLQIKPRSHMRWRN